MSDDPQVQVSMDPQTGLVISFLMAFQLLWGELEGLAIAVKLTTGDQEVFAQAREGIISKIKAVWEAFGLVTRSELMRSPEEILSFLPPVLSCLEQLKPKLDWVEADVLMLGAHKKAYREAFAGNKKLPWLH